MASNADEQSDAKLEGQGVELMDEEDGVMSDSLEASARKSARERKLTPKMKELKEQETVQKEKKFSAAYEKW